MNTVRLLAAQPWVERLGATLLHFLWEGLLIAILYAAVRHAARRSRPSLRYAAACAALTIMAAAPVITWLMLRPALASGIPAFTPVTQRHAAAAAARTIVAALLDPAEGTASASLLPWVVAAWLAGVAVFWLRLTTSWILAQRLRAALVRPAPAEWQRVLDGLAIRLRLSRPARLLVSALAQAPAVIGALRPVILMPLGALAGMPPEQVEALLLHELAHIRRHDYLVNAAQSIVEALLFYHPAVWWVSGHIRAERELCCDDVAVAITGDAPVYARALAEMASARFTPGAAMAASGGHLSYRVARLLGQSRPAARVVSGPGTVVAALLPAVAALAAFGQSAGSPAFAVASVKPGSSEAPRSVRLLPGRLLADAPARLLIQRAYGVQSFQIAGGPRWMDSERFEVEGKSGAPATRADLLRMLQTLLEDRFQLRFHRETRELPIYALVAGKDGPRLPPARLDGCVEASPGSAPEWAGGRMAVPARGPLALPLCGTAGVALQFQGAVLQAASVGTPELARELSFLLERTVVDRTGFTGLFDLRLTFQPDDATPSMPPPPPGGAPDPAVPSLPQALQHVGLRIESTRGPVEVLVIDRLDRPAAN